MFAIEYRCPACKPTHEGRFFKEPDAADLEAYKTAASQYKDAPKDLIPTNNPSRGRNGPGSAAGATAAMTRCLTSGNCSGFLLARI